MFLATVAHESKTALVEVGVGDLYGKNGVDYRGGGYTQLTGYTNYNAFAEQMLKDGLVELDKNGNNSITSESGEAEYIKENFAWEAAGWHWTAPGNNINNRIENGADFYKVSQVINVGLIIQEYLMDALIEKIHIT